MRATELFNRRVIVAENAFAEIVAWKLPHPLPGSTHAYKYRLALIADGRCVLRYDNEWEKAIIGIGGREKSLTAFRPSSGWWWSFLTM